MTESERMEDSQRAETLPGMTGNTVHPTQAHQDCTFRFYSWHEMFRGEAISPQKDKKKHVLVLGKKVF